MLEVKIQLKKWTKFSWLLKKYKKWNICSCRSYKYLLSSGQSYNHDGYTIAVKFVIEVPKSVTISTMKTFK